MGHLQFLTDHTLPGRLIFVVIHRYHSIPRYVRLHHTLSLRLPYTLAARFLRYVLHLRFDLFVLALRVRYRYTLFARLRSHAIFVTRCYPHSRSHAHYAFTAVVLPRWVYGVRYTFVYVLHYYHVDFVALPIRCHFCHLPLSRFTTTVLRLRCLSGLPVATRSHFILHSVLVGYVGFTVRIVRLPDSHGCSVTFPFSPLVTAILLYGTFTAFYLLIYTHTAVIQVHTARDLPDFDCRF